MSFFTIAIEARPNGGGKFVPERGVTTGLQRLLLAGRGPEAFGGASESGGGINCGVGESVRDVGVKTKAGVHVW